MIISVKASTKRLFDMVMKAANFFCPPKEKVILKIAMTTIIENVVVLAKTIILSTLNIE